MVELFMTPLPRWERESRLTAMQSISESPRQVGAEEAQPVVTAKAARLFVGPAAVLQRLDQEVQTLAEGWAVPVAVVISYRTVFVSEDGLVQFRPDVYGLDTQLTLALSQKVAAFRSEPRQW